MIDGSFERNKYCTWYETLIEFARKRQRAEGTYYEKHHVVPRSLGGSDRSDNIVHLTPREHFMAHLLLPKMVKGPAVYKMVFAFFRMKKHAVTSRSYDFFRVAYSKRTKGENNPFFGKKHTPESLAKMRGENHPMFGRKHREDSLVKMRIAQNRPGRVNGMTGKKQSEKWRRNHSKMMSGENHPGYGKVSPTKGNIGITNGFENKQISKTDEIPIGWRKGYTQKRKGGGRRTVGMIMINDGQNTKQIWPSEIDQYPGWSRGYRKITKVDQSSPSDNP